MNDFQRFIEKMQAEGTTEVQPDGTRTISVKKNPKQFLAELFPTSHVGECCMCHSDVRINGFRDALSEKEFGISRMCQSCQDVAFAEPEDT
jgi:hypothetical protein